MTRRSKTRRDKAYEAAYRARVEAEERALKEADPRDAYVPVAMAYSRQFHREIWTWRMDPARYPALIAAMQAAMQADRPLTCDEATAITGASPPPLNAVG
jgi:hypothetical protein